MVTLTDRLLISFGILPAPVPKELTRVAVNTTTAKTSNSLEDLRDIPRYPPFMEGLPIYAPATLLATQKELIDGIRHLIANQELLEAHYNPAMLRLAGLVQLLPASQAHHHRGAGGLLRHSLEVGLWSLQQTEGKLIRGVVTPQLRRVIEPRWRLTVFLAGICHDLGKVVTDIAVTDRSNELRWRPYNQSLFEWAKTHSIDNYFLHWQEGRGKKHTNVSSTLINAVISENTLDWLSDGGTDAVIWLTESLNNNPGPTNQIHNFMVRADQLSVERDLKSMGVAMAGYEIGVPIERYLTDIMRRLVQEGLWRINEPSARVWNIDGTTYLVWPMAGEEIARRTKDEDIPGLPKTADGILDMMVEREIAYLRESDSDPFFYIAPDVVTEKIPNMRLKAIRLRDQALISSMPIAPISGQIHSSKAAPKEKASTTPAPLESIQQELPLLNQSTASTSVEHVAQIVIEGAPPQNNYSTPVEHVTSTTNEVAKPQENPAVTSSPEKTNRSVQRLELDSLDGAMGELLRVLIGEFKTGKKSFSTLGVNQPDGCVYLKWPDAFAGYGFTPKQILSELSELGWMIPASDVAKVGDAVFAGGTAKSIKLSAAIGRLFEAPKETSPPPADEGHTGITTPSIPSESPLPAIPRADLAEKKKRVPRNSKLTATMEPNSGTNFRNGFSRIALMKTCKGKSIVRAD